jgi:type II secretory pathway pseudopilin PulG
MWGYAEGDATLVAIVVAIVVIAALAYVGRALWQRRR